MQNKPKKKVYTIELMFKNGLTRSVKQAGSTREVAENRALKFNPAATGVKRSA